MIKKYVYDENIKIDRNVACIGFFDGVHIGHQELINKTIALARKKGIEANIITFNPDPLDVIGGKKNKHINSFKERIALFNKFGLDNVVVIPFSEDIMNLSSNDFIKKVLLKLSIETLVCGFDFTFGKKGLGNPDTLIKKGINTLVIEEKKYYGKKVSSTRIKDEIKKENYRLVNKLLGYEYRK